MRQHPARAGRPRFLCPLPLPHCPARRHQRRAYGIDWSGARRAGDKIWRAELDFGRRTVVKVDRPWASLGQPEAAQAVAVWLQTLDGAWVAIDAPFSLAASDLAALVGADGIKPRAWSRQLMQRYSDCQTFIDAATAQNLIGRHRRTTDQNRRSPFAPTLLQLIYQTHAACHLLASLVGTCVRIMPWDHAAAGPVTLVETCPAILIKSLGFSNHGYKLKPGSDELQRALLEAILARLDWRADAAIAHVVEQDAEGDALDAILCGLAAVNASTPDHAVIAGHEGALQEGWIYV